MYTRDLFYFLLIVVFSTLCNDIAAVSYEVMNNGQLRSTLVVALSMLGLASLLMNVVYVVKYGPPYQSNVEEDKPPFAPLSALALRGKPIRVARRSLDSADNWHTNYSTSSEMETTASSPISTSPKSKTSSSANNSKTTSITAVSTTTASSDQSTFVLAGSYLDPTSLLTKSLFQLGQFASSLSMSNLVVPWVFGYRSYGAKRLVANADKGLSCVALNRLYDLRTLSNQLSQCTGGVSVVSFSDFVEKSSRNIAVIYFMRDTFIEPRQLHLQKEAEKHLFDSELSKSKFVDCLKGNHSQNIVKHLLDGLNAELAANDNKKFHITSFTCVDNRKTIKMSEVKNFLQKQKCSDTLLLLNWRGLANLTKEPYDKSKYWVDGNWKYPNDKCYDPIVPFHFEVPKMAHQFLPHAGVTEVNYLGVYIAIEALAKLVNNPYTECCMKETKRVVRAMLSKYHLKGAIIIVEYTNHSKTGCDYNCVTKALAMVDMLKSLGLNISQFDPAVVGSKHHHLTFNSFAEVSMVSTGKRLLLVGQSLWYYQIKTRFIQHYPPDGANKLYALCTNSGTYLRDLPSKTADCDKLR